MEPIDAIRARMSQPITDIVDNPREYYRVQQILRDRTDLLAYYDRLYAAAKKALHEMVHTSAPRNSFTDAVDELDAALSGRPPVSAGAELSK
jgi:hypothetical protein